MYNRNIHNKIGADKIKLTFHSRDRALERLGISEEKELRILASNARNKGYNLNSVTISNYDKIGLTYEELVSFKRNFQTKNNSERIMYHKGYVYVFAGKNACTLKTVVKLRKI